MAGVTVGVNAHLPFIGNLLLTEAEVSVDERSIDVGLNQGDSRIGGLELFYPSLPVEKAIGL